MSEICELSVHRFGILKSNVSLGFAQSSSLLGIPWIFFFAKKSIFHCMAAGSFHVPLRPRNAHLREYDCGSNLHTDRSAEVSLFFFPSPMSVWARTRISIKASHVSSLQHNFPASHTNTT
jgi:hypothetical protein